MENFLSNLSPEVVLLFGINFILIIIIFIISMANKSKIIKLKDKYYKFMNGHSDINMEELLGKCIDDINRVSVKNREIENHINNIERNLIQCIQKIGVVRYNAFEDVGSDLSFSVALLNSNDDGLVMSSIYSRDSSITYAKPILSGKSRYTLSAEEVQAIDLAKKSGR